MICKAKIVKVNLNGKTHEEFMLEKLKEKGITNSKDILLDFFGIDDNEKYIFRNNDIYEVVPIVSDQVFIIEKNSDDSFFIYAEYDPESTCLGEMIDLRLDFDAKFNCESETPVRMYSLKDDKIVKNVEYEKNNRI
jgi:hypothetical protein